MEAPAYTAVLEVPINHFVVLPVSVFQLKISPLLEDLC